VQLHEVRLRCSPKDTTKPTKIQFKELIFCSRFVSETSLIQRENVKSLDHDAEGKIINSLWECILYLFAFLSLFVISDKPNLYVTDAQPTAGRPPTQPQVGAKCGESHSYKVCRRILYAKVVSLNIFTYFDKLLERNCIKQTQTSFSYERCTVYLYFEIFPKFNTALLKGDNKVLNTCLAYMIPSNCFRISHYPLPLSCLKFYKVEYYKSESCKK
jgi:hypothetical protein